MNTADKQSFWQYIEKHSPQRIDSVKKAFDKLTEQDQELCIYAFKEAFDSIELVEKMETLL